MKTKTDEDFKHQDGLLSRWEKRKHAVLREKMEGQQREADKVQEKLNQENYLTDEDMPSLESLTADSDYTCFMSPKVSDALRRLALRKLFHGAEFNIRDGLDDYDGDYTSFAKLGSIVTADMKHQMEMEIRKKARLLEEQEAKSKLSNEQLALADGGADDTKPEGDKLVSDDSQEMDKHAEQERKAVALTQFTGVDMKYETESEADNNDEFDDEDDLDGGVPG